MAQVTFAVPIYNVGAYIGDCVRSLYAQTLEDIEILLIDDCSTDESMAIALKVLEDYPHRKHQVRVLRHEHNMGIAVSRKDCVDCATGEYILQVDADDWVEPEMGAKMYARAKAANADSVVCDYYIVTSRKEYYHRFVCDDRVGENGELIKEDIINRRVSPNIWVHLVRRGLFYEKPFRWAQGGYGEDMLLTSQMAFYSQRIEYVDEALYHYRHRDDSISRTCDAAHTMRIFEGYQSVFADWEAFFEDNGQLDRYWYGARYNKMLVRNLLLPLTGQKRYRKLFFSTYPEINRFFLFGDKECRAGYREWVFIIAVFLGLYPTMKQQLLSKRLHPRKGWSVFSPR